MATQKRPLPSASVARNEAERTIFHIFDDAYVTQAFENLVGNVLGDIPTGTAIRWVRTNGTVAGYIVVDDTGIMTIVTDGEVNINGQIIGGVI